MTSSWIFEDNLLPFLTALGWIVDYDFDDNDWTAVYFGVRDTDCETKRWYDYDFSGASVASIKFARDPGSSVIFVEVEIAEAHRAQAKLALDIFARFTVAGAKFRAPE